MNLTEMVGWALVQFVWEGLAIAALLAVALTMTRHRPATTRYALGVAAMALMLIAPIVTVAVMARGQDDESALFASEKTVLADEPSTRVRTSGVPTRDEQTAGTLAGEPAPRAVAIALSENIRRGLPYIVTAWITGVVLLGLRLVGGWVQVQRLRRVGVRPVQRQVRALFDELIGRMGIRRSIELLETAVLDAPAAIGWLRPVVLVPASALTGLTPMQLEALLAHELAHIRRYDYAVNLIQSLVETLLFYHPAVWWVSGRVRAEREHCCDDLAVATCGDARLLAGALASMEQIRIATPALVMAATGGALFTRIRRLVQPRVAHVEGLAVARRNAGGRRGADGGRWLAIG